MEIFLLSSSNCGLTSLPQGKKTYAGFCLTFALLLNCMNFRVMDKIWGQKQIKWSPITPSEVKGDTGLRYLQIDDEPAVIEEPFLQRMNFWEALPLREYGGETTMTPYSRFDFNFDDGESSSDYF